MMMKILENIGKFVVLLAVVMAVSCSVLERAVEKPTVSVNAVRFQSVSLNEGRLDSQLQVYNPNAFALPTRKVTYHLKLNGRDIISSELVLDKNLPAKGTVALSVPIRFHYSEVLQGITSIFQLGRIQYQLLGDVDVGFMTIPFSRSGEFVPQR